MRTVTSWGNYPKIRADIELPTYKSAVIEAVRSAKEIIPRGNGRSYGDSSLGVHIISSLAIDHLVELNRQSRTIKVHAGVTIEQLLEFLIPRGFFPPVVPGTKYITIGGAVASDIHGKNHHKEGTFTDHVTQLSLISANGDQVTCSRQINPDLFQATCGGMGLTGFIHEVEFSLKEIRSDKITQITHRAKNIDELFSLFEMYQHKEYSVAWIDCLSSGNSLGRGLMFSGEHSEDAKKLEYHNHQFALPMPMFRKGILSAKLNKVFNFFYYRKNIRKISKQIIGLDSFFFPLDKIKCWNNLYGEKGFTQYQCVLPKNSGKEGVRKILEKVSGMKNASFLAVLKLFGPKNDNFLSFPIEGYTLSLDFKVSSELFSFIKELNEIVIELGGRVYLTKDVSLTKDEFEKMYGPNIQAFQEVRKKHHAMKFASLQSRRLGL